VATELSQTLPEHSTREWWGCELPQVSDVEPNSQRVRAGRKPLKGGRATAAFVLRQDQIAWLALRARNRDLSKSEYVRQLIDDAMKLALV